LTDFDLRVQQIHRWVNQAPTERRAAQRQENVSAKALPQGHQEQVATSQNEKRVAMPDEKNLGSHCQQLAKSRHQKHESRRQSHQESQSELQNADSIDVA
jgi:hypothetical protein